MPHYLRNSWGEFWGEFWGEISPGNPYIVFDHLRKEFPQAIKD